MVSFSKFRDSLAFVLVSLEAFQLSVSSVWASNSCASASREGTWECPQNGVMPDGGDATARQWVDALNKYRCMHNYPAVVWVPEVKKLADCLQGDGVDVLPIGHTSIGERTVDGYLHAENVAAFQASVGTGYTYSPRGFVDYWYNETEYCSSWVDGCTTSTVVGQPVGHFTAMIWKGVAGVACGTVPYIITQEFAEGSLAEQLEGHGLDPAEALAQAQSLIGEKFGAKAYCLYRPAEDGYEVCYNSNWGFGEDDADYSGMVTRAVNAEGHSAEDCERKATECGDRSSTGGTDWEDGEVDWESGGEYTSTDYSGLYSELPNSKCNDTEYTPYTFAGGSSDTSGGSSDTSGGSSDDTAGGSSDTSGGSSDTSSDTSATSKATLATTQFNVWALLAVSSGGLAVLGKMAAN